MYSQSEVRTHDRGTFFLVLAAAGGGMMGHAFPGVISHTALFTESYQPGKS